MFIFKSCFRLPLLSPSLLLKLPNNYCVLVFRQSFEKCCDVDVCNNMMIREDVEDIGFEMRIEHTQEKINLLTIARVLRMVLEKLSNLEEDLMGPLTASCWQLK